MDDFPTPYADRQDPGGGLGRVNEYMSTLLWRFFLYKLPHALGSLMNRIITLSSLKL